MTAYMQKFHWMKCIHKTKNVTEKLAEKKWLNNTEICWNHHKMLNIKRYCHDKKASFLNQFMLFLHYFYAQIKVFKKNILIFWIRTGNIVSKIFLNFSFCLRVLAIDLF